MRDPDFLYEIVCIVHHVLFETLILYTFTIEFDTKIWYPNTVQLCRKHSETSGTYTPATM